MKKISFILEAQNRVHGGGNPFSNGHRSRANKDGFLKSHFMLDLDEIIYDQDNKIIALVEKKYKADSVKLGNILKQPTIQKGVLLHLSNILKCKLFVNITSEDKYYRIDSLTDYKEFSSESFAESSSKYLKYNSDDMIYVEYKKSGQNFVIKAITRRLADNIDINGLLSLMSQKLNVPIIKVDDNSDVIKFYKSTGPGGVFVGKVESIQDPSSLVDDSKRRQLEDDWESIYRKLGIWD